MYIREIKITGFRSYCELTTISNFSPKHNVIVGRNGSGKSNFFFAIQFVLSNEFNNLNQEQRNNLLHEGTGSRAPQALVEIVFDNSFRRLPSDANEVRISRQVSTKKDQYFIDGKVATRVDILNMLESAGISRCNPYYIVKQGKVMELATQADAQRLKLIREVAGTRVFDERKDESEKLLNETQGKLSKCEQLLGLMAERLKKLEEEKEDLKEYQKFDKMKRAIEYTMNTLECNEARVKCDQLSDKRHDLNLRQNHMETDMMSVQQSILKVESDIRKLEARFKGFRDERDSLLFEQTELTEKKTGLELLIADLQEDVDKLRNGRYNAQELLEKLKKDIQERQDELEELEPRYSELTIKESELQTDMKIKEQNCKELNAKLGRKDQFKTEEERDRYLQREIAMTDQQMTEADSQISEIERSVVEENEETLKLQNIAVNCQRELQDIILKLEEQNAALTVQRQDADEANSNLKDAHMQENTAREQLSNLQTEIANEESSLFSLAPKGIANGIRSVQYVLDWMKNNNGDNKYKEVIEGYYGTVLEHLNTDPAYFLAVEVTAETRLFYHVVKDDRVAMRILDQMNSRELSGEVNFFPLNRVAVKPRRDVNDNEAEPLLGFLEYDQLFDSVMRQLFADTVVVPNLSVGSRVSRNDRFNCVTVDGDQVNRRGPLTGGYLDRKRSKLEVSTKLKLLKSQLLSLKVKVEEKCKASNESRLIFERIRLDINQLETELNIQRQQHQSINEKQHHISEQLNRRATNREPKNAQIVQLKERLRRMDARKKLLLEQLGTPLESILSQDEKAKIDKWQDEIKDMKNLLENVSRERMEVENRKHRLENQLHSNLLRKRDNLEAEMRDICVDEKRYRLEAELGHEKQLIVRLTNIMNRIGVFDNDLSDYNADREALIKELEALQDKKRKLEDEIELIAKQTDKYCTRMADYQQKKEDFSKRMNDIGLVPSDSVAKYQNLNLKQLDKKLTECMNELKKYENVNKKALDQFVRANGQKEKLSKSLEELKRNEASIKSLIDVLDNRRHETLQVTFGQVATNFREVFKKLIPDGRAELIMQVEDPTESSQSSGNSGSQDQASHLSGIGMKVSFTGTSETRELNHLSGGQKSLVALALIFAIQKCDPAPFYLFDEIDAALDRQHRQAVAAMIHELSENAQFITTTFRPELLERAEKFYGVRFRNKVSYIDPISLEEAHDFVTDDQTYN